MNISSRTPEGLPSRCPHCGDETRIEYSVTAGDACCPRCGGPLWQQEHLTEGEKPDLLTLLAKVLGLSRDELVSGSFGSLEDLGVDSLTQMELVMEVEEEYDCDLSDDEALALLRECDRLVQRARECGVRAPRYRAKRSWWFRRKRRGRRA